MQKVEYRYYELSQDLPVLVLTGKKWETVYGTDNMHFHNYLEIGFCHYGNGTIQFAENEFPYHAGTISFIPKNIPHRTCPAQEEQTKKQKWEYLFIDQEAILKNYFANAPEKYMQIEKRLVQRKVVLEDAEKTKAALFIQMIVEEMNQKASHYKYTVPALTLNLILYFDRFQDTKQKQENSSVNAMDYTRKMISYIETHYKEDIQAGDIAKACNLSETHMRRIFLEATNTTPVEYLNLTRIQKACELLLKEKYSMEEVANLVGYPIQSTFMRNFKKITGTSPTAWRKIALKNPENIAAYKVSVLKGW